MIEPATILKWKAFRNEKADRASRKRHGINLTKIAGITQLYNKFFEEPTSQLFKLHAKLDRQCNAAYGFIDSDNILDQLLALNLELAETEKQGEPIVGPAAPN